MQAQPLKIRHKLRIDWSDLDMFGHVNNISILRFVQSARVNYWELAGIAEMFAIEGKGPMLLSTGCQFKRPLFYPGSVVVFSGIEFIKNTSFGIEHKLFDAEGNLVAEARDIMVMYDFRKSEKIPFPDLLRMKVEQLEERKI